LKNKGQDTKRTGDGGEYRDIIRKKFTNNRGVVTYVIDFCTGNSNGISLFIFKYRDQQVNALSRNKK
jgi:hypothetical protein